MEGPGEGGPAAAGARQRRWPQEGQEEAARQVLQQLQQFKQQQQQLEQQQQQLEQQQLVRQLQLRLGLGLGLLVVIQ